MSITRSAAIADELRRIVDAGMPGAFVYIDDPGGHVEFHTAGVADLDSGRLMTPDSHYRVGSTTKTFTGVVVLQLVAEGRLALDDLVFRWLPDLTIPNGSSLTIEHLLRMRSGLFDFEDHPSLLGNLDAHLVPHALEEVIAFGVAGTPKFQPGERSEYCNTNFLLLERVVERVTGRSLQRELVDRIFDPLELHDTSYPDETDLSLPDPYIRGYDWNDAGWRECSREFFGRGDGALISTALDVSRFFRALFGGRLVSEDLLAKMQTIIPSDPPPKHAYGMALIRDSLPCGTVWGHSGGGFGYRHLPFLFPENGRFVICMVNGTWGFRAETRPAEERPEFSPEMRAATYTA